MKTDKFEKIIRQKLESISPDFHEEDWSRMQNYMQPQTAPSFWKQYASWLGYAAAASVTSVMAFMYTHQLSLNSQMATDLSKVKSQMAALQNTPSVIQKTDTVYIVQQEIAKPRFETLSSSEEKMASSEIGTITFLSADQSPTTKQDQTDNALVEKHERVYAQGETQKEFSSDQNSTPKASQNVTAGNSTNQLLAQSEVEGKSLTATPSPNGNVVPQTPLFTKTLDNQFADLQEIHGIQITEGKNRSMTYALTNRLSPRQAKKVWLAQASTSSKKASVEPKKVEKTNQTENIIPQLNIRAPYRFGVSYQFEGNNQAKTVVGEVLVAKKFSISAGLSWLRIKPMKFINEKVFRDRNHQDFRRSHPGNVPPMGFEISNIHIKPQLMQIPLTVAFRNDITKDFSYYVGTGTNITVKGEESISFDCRLPMPGREFQSQSFQRKMNIPLVNSLTFNAGIEKNWHPIVVQIEGYLYTYFKSFNPENPKTGPGLKVKLLYQVGKKM